MVSTKGGNNVDCVCLSPSRFSGEKNIPICEKKNSMNAYTSKKIHFDASADASRNVLHDMVVLFLALIIATICD